MDSTRVPQPHRHDHHNEDVETYYSGLERLQENPHEATPHFCYDG